MTNQLMQSLIQVLEFPSSAILAVLFLLVAYALHHYAGDTKIVRTLSTMQAARILLAIGAVMLAVEGTWSIELHKTALFVIYALVLLLSLAFTIQNGMQMRTNMLQKAKLGFMLNHVGIFLIVWAALFGAPDVSKMKTIINRGESVNVAYTLDGKVMPLPFDISLQDFRIDYYDDDISPKQFTSSITVGAERMEVSVNNPGSYKGYTIYQDSYDWEYGRYSVLQIVRDPWLPFVYLGMALLAIGSVMLLFGKWRAKFVILVTLVLTILFTVLTIAKVNFTTMMPALRSWWFVPHLFIYMVAYSLMAIALFMWLMGNARNKEQWMTVSDNMMRSSCALLIVGMLTGSVWARQAWGDYWAWDPKENWAAVTWFISLMHIHLHNRRGWRAIVILVLAFLALQITWYGVNYLPSATDSMHTYNS